MFRPSPMCRVERSHWREHGAAVGPLRGRTEQRAKRREGVRGRPRPAQIFDIRQLLHTPHIRLTASPTEIGAAARLLAASRQFPLATDTPLYRCSVLAVT